MKKTKANKVEETKTRTQFHTHRVNPIAPFNRLHALLYSGAIIALVYHRLTSPFSLSTISLLVAELVLALMWGTSQAFRWRPVRRQEFPEHLMASIGKEGLPALDVFVCTADPYKEPPSDVASTVLSVMGFDYPTDRLSVYVSDDGGSDMTLFALMEAARFARHWLPFCRENGIEQRSPEAYFRDGEVRSGYSDEIKVEGGGSTLAKCQEWKNIAEAYKADRNKLKTEVKDLKGLVESLTRRDGPQVAQAICLALGARNVFAILLKPLLLHVDLRPELTKVTRKLRDAEQEWAFHLTQNKRTFAMYKEEQEMATLYWKLFQRARGYVDYALEKLVAADVSCRRRGIEVPGLSGNIEYIQREVAWEKEAAVTQAPNRRPAAVSFGEPLPYHMPNPPPIF